MDALICQISKQDYYMGEDEQKGIGYTNFINFNGMYYGHFSSTGLDDLISEHHQVIDYVIFVSENKVVGWYKNATVYRDEQFYQKNCPYFVTCKDTDAYLLDIKDRTFKLVINKNYEMKRIDRRLANLLKQNNHINYQQSDLNKQAIIPLNGLETACKWIENEMVSHHYLDALYITNKALALFGNLPSLIYYKAWVLYSLLQYKESSFLLSKIRNISQFSDFVYYMLGNIYFETGEYEVAIKMFNQVKQQNKDSTLYMLAQSYAMIYEVQKAKECIKNAITYNNNQPAYFDFLKQLEEWENEKVS